MPSDPILINISTEIPDAILDVRYAGENNFTGNRLYRDAVVWLRPEPLASLKEASKNLRAKGYKIVIFDAFRPLSVQDKLRAVCSDENYVKEISNHCRGITVDLTLADEHDKYLNMGTDYDDFSEAASPTYKDLSQEELRNRQLLSDEMRAQGFTQHPFEWWHFDYKLESSWELIDDERNAY